MSEPRYAIVHVKDGPNDAWPVVERVAGGWQSGAHHYPDATVLSVEPLTLAGPADVVVRLPAPVDVSPSCGCAIPPDGAPGAHGCCAECMTPALAWFEGGVTLDVQDGAIYDGTGRTFEADAAELQAARLLSAAALWRATGRTPKPIGPQ